MKTMLSTILKWAARTFAAIAILMIFLGFYGYLMGNIQVFGVRHGTYLLFSEYVFYASALFFLLTISFKENK